MELSRVFESAPKIVEVGVGETIFARGDGSAEMYGVIEGVVEIRIDDKTLETVTAGAFFGEMALIDASARSASAVAQTRCRLAVLDEERFLFMVQQTPFFAVQVMRVLVARLRAMDRRLR